MLEEQLLYPLQVALSRTLKEGCNKRARGSSCTQSLTLHDLHHVCSVCVLQSVLPVSSASLAYRVPLLLLREGLH